MTDLGRLASLCKIDKAVPRKRSNGRARARVLHAWGVLRHQLGYDPTVRQVAAKLGLVPSTVQHHLAKLREEGKIPAARGRGYWRLTA